MKVQLLSDLHVEHFRNLAAFQDAYENKFGNKLWENVSGIDVLVLAGDIASTTTYKEVMLECSKKFKHVMVVAGNHEFYGSEYFECLKSMKEACEPIENVHFLDKGVVEVEVDGEKVVFLGCTLWSRVPEVAKTAVGRSLNDYFMIKVEQNEKKSTLTVDFTNKLFMEESKWLENEIEKYATEKVIVVTHHAPLIKGVSDPVYENASGNSRLLNSAFASDMTSVFKSNVLAWFFGHTHYSSKQKYQGTLIASNQLGYLAISDGNTGFEENWIFDTLNYDLSKVKEFEP